MRILESIGFGALCGAIAYVGAALIGWDGARAAVVVSSATTAMWLVRSITHGKRSEPGKQASVASARRSRGAYRDAVESAREEEPVAAEPEPEPPKNPGAVDVASLPRFLEVCTMCGSRLHKVRMVENHGDPYLEWKCRCLGDGCGYATRCRPKLWKGTR